MEEEGQKDCRNQKIGRTGAELYLQAQQDYYTHAFTAAGVCTRSSQLTSQHAAGGAHEPLLLGNY